MHRTLPALCFFLACSSLAQTGDDWSTPFPSPPPANPAAVPPKKPAAAEPPAPPRKQQPPAATPSGTQPAPSTRLKEEPADAPRTEPKPKAGTGSGPSTPPTDKDSKDADALPIVSKKESFLPGTEPHSPSTWGAPFDAPTNGRVTLGTVTTGTPFVPGARMGPKGLVRVGVIGEYLSITDFPVRNATDIRSGITFAASFQPFSWGEAYVGYTAAANTNNRTSPNLIQALGDLSFGIKASNEWTKGFHAGVDLRLLTFSGVGNQGIDRFAVGFKPNLLVAFDVRRVAPKVPIIANVAAGFVFDSTSNLVTQRLNASEEFALGINRYNRFTFGASLEVPLPIVTPFVEYGLATPLGVAGGVLTGPDGSSVPVGSALPQQLGLGLKVTAIKDLTIVSGVNLGLTRSVGLGVPATPPWNFFVGASFAIDPFQRGETKTIETVRERKVEQKVAEAPKTSRVEGTVLSASTKAPIAGAVIASPGVLPSATDAQGRFTTLEIKDAKVRLTISRDGFKAVDKDLVLEPSKTANVEVLLEDDVKKAFFEVAATSNKKAVKAIITLKGPATTTIETSEAMTSAGGTSSLTEVEVPAGTYTASVTADGFLSQTREVQIPPGGKMPLTFELVPTPKKALVIFKGDKIEILQQVHFATGKATILADSYSLLQQVVDVIVRNNVRAVTVEGHTDNKGVKGANQKLSEDRARAVADYLIAQGVDAKRIESIGYGDSKPVAPNLTARGRELNRRVEFIVPEK